MKYLFFFVAIFIASISYAQQDSSELFTDQDAEAWLVEGFFQKDCSLAEADSILFELDLAWEYVSDEDTTGLYTGLSKQATDLYEKDLDEGSYDYSYGKDEIAALEVYGYDEETDSLMIVVFVYNLSKEKNMAIHSDNGYAIIRPGGVVAFCGSISELSIVDSRKKETLIKWFGT